MLLRLVRPMKRKGVSQLYFVQRIPADVKSSLVGKALLFPVGDSLTRVEITNKTVSVRLSLRTNNESEGKIRQAAVAAHLEWVWRSLRERPRSLTQKEATALAGEVYKQFTSALEDDPGEAEQWRRVQKDNLSAFAGDFGGSSLLIGDEARKAAALAERFGPFVDLVLARKAIRVDEASRGKLLQQIARAMHEASVTLTRNADGDYRPDDNAARFPQWDNKASGACPVSAQGVTLDTLLEGWSREARAAGKASVSTADGYSRSIRVLVKFLGHDDPARVTPENVVAFKDARLAEINPRTGKPVSAKTVNDGDLVALKTVFWWGVRNRKLASNPATGITVAVAVPMRLRPKGFTDVEALAILQRARAYKPMGAELPKTTAAKQWVPWLCAFTGARLGEMVQLRKQDIKREGSVYVLRITPEAGTVKGRKYRDVPLHPQLVALGFPDFVNRSRDGYLFFTPTKSGGWRGPWRAVKNRVSVFVRKVVSDPQVQPNHGWRHRFITTARRHGMDQELRRMITGHKGEGVDEAVYGDPAGLYREICKLPRYKVG